MFLEKYDKQMKKTNTLVISLMVGLFTMSQWWAPPSVFAKTIHQSYEIYSEGGQYKVRGRINFQTYFTSSEADQAIQYALDSVARGGEVYLHPGSYLLTQQVSIPSYVSLRGSGSGTVLEFGENHGINTALLARDANRVVLSDFSIRDEYAQAQVGIWLDHCGDCLVEDVLIVGMLQHGITLSNNSFLCEIRGTRVAASGSSGILLKDLARGGRGGDYVPNLVTNCIIYGGNKGFECDNALVANIVGCQVYQTNGYGFYLHNGSNSVLLSGCRTYQISDNAVVVESSHEINISSNIFCWHTGHGIVLSNVLWGTITGNNIIDSGSINLFDPREDTLITTGKRPFTKRPDSTRSINNYNGILIQSASKGLTVSSNAIFSWPVVPPMEYGIQEDSSCFSNLITANNINFCRREAIDSKGEATQVANNISYTKEPYYGKPSRAYQFYDTRLLDSFIEELKSF